MLQQLVKTNDVSAKLPFYMSTGSGPFTGLAMSLSIELAKNLGAFGAAAGDVTEVGNGWYFLGNSVDDVNTSGPMILRATHGSGPPTDVVFQVLDSLPADVRFLVGSDGAATGLYNMSNEYANNNWISANIQAVSGDFGLGSKLQSFLQNGYDSSNNAVRADVVSFLGAYESSKVSGIAKLGSDYDNTGKAYADVVAIGSDAQAAEGLKYIGTEYQARGWIGADLRAFGGSQDDAAASGVGAMGSNFNLYGGALDVNIRDVAHVTISCSSAFDFYDQYSRVVQIGSETERIYEKVYGADDNAHLLTAEAMADGVWQANLKKIVDQDVYANQPFSFDHLTEATYAAFGTTNTMGPSNDPSTLSVMSIVCLSGSLDRNSLVGKTVKMTSGPAVGQTSIIRTISIGGPPNPYTVDPPFTVDPGTASFIVYETPYAVNDLGERLPSAEQVGSPMQTGEAVTLAGTSITALSTQINSDLTAAHGSGAYNLFGTTEAAALAGLAGVPDQITSLGSDLAAIGSTVDAIYTRVTSAPVTVVSPVSSNGDGITLNLIRGDDYVTSVNRQIIFAASSPTPTTADTIVLTIRKYNGDVVGSPITFSARTTTTISFDIPHAITDLLDPSLGYNFDVEAIFGDARVTYQRGNVVVLQDETRH